MVPQILATNVDGDITKTPPLRTAVFCLWKTGDLFFVLVLQRFHLLERQENELYIHKVYNSFSGTVRGRVVRIYTT